MARQWSGRLATQTAHFRGVSTVNVLTTATAMPQFRMITAAVYDLVVTGGVSGSFGVQVLGQVNGTTYIIAGLTAVTAAGKKIMYPVGYSSTGAAYVPGAANAGAGSEDINRLDMILPPFQVAFESGVATAGISASCTVNAYIVDGND